MLFPNERKTLSTSLEELPETTQPLLEERYKRLRLLERAPHFQCILQGGKPGISSERAVRCAFNTSDDDMGRSWDAHGVCV